jgi:hypothetical protein
MAAYPITTPVNFNGAGLIDFNASAIRDFVTTAQGDLLYRSSAMTNDVDRLPIGANGTVLTSNGTVPTWAASSASLTSFMATASAAIAPVPASDSWNTLNNTYVTWNDSTGPNHDAGAAFVPATGAYTVPATGIYQVSATVHFQGNATGNVPATITTPPVGLATRQLQALASTTGVLSFGMEQAEASGSNPTKVTLSATNVSLVAAETVVLQVRHDAGSSLNMEINSGQTWFSIHRVS